jgi:hypothetical protein
MQYNVVIHLSVGCRFGEVRDGAGDPRPSLFSSLREVSQDQLSKLSHPSYYIILVLVYHRILFSLSLYCLEVDLKLGCVWLDWTDCGAGVGRITDQFLLRRFHEVDLVEPLVRLSFF